MNDDDIVGHKTFSDGRGGFRHEPLTRKDADAIWEACQAAIAKRAADMPTEQDAVTALWSAYQRLKELGWKDARYAPTDGEHKLVIEIGSSGIHEARCEVQPNKPSENWWWIDDEHDTWPSKPILYREKSSAAMQAEGKE